ncbi:flavin-dependent dehydrogenase [Naumannella halotolerans]|uniref:Flavin-dependent dehydrogenase n=2 Tax=Naumannella halotolerans TaxID=993414 RepID=A0A4R7IZ61_9ACTN|nr:flavin-dependent dehydrogenase [Naumannella halotolerans]
MNTAGAGSPLSLVNAHVDVVILGGGIAGLTLALQLCQSRPQLSVVVAEKVTPPIPEAAHKVGESTVEIAAHYLRDVLGLADHLDQEHLNKFGLRVFFSDGDNTDISRRRELGHAVAPPQKVGTFQIDRGRIENALTQMVSELPQVTMLNATTAIEVLMDDEADHVVTLRSGAADRQVRSRWVIDSTGRAAFIKRKLGLSEKVGHRANAVWLRVATDIDVDDWSSDAEWHDRIRESCRRLSTNHLMGHGYWVWIIPLASGATSIGIVTDPDIHKFADLNSLEKAIAWLDTHEPQCATAVRSQLSRVLDFRVMHDYAFGASQVFSADRWCLAGDAGIFLDPLYSPGMDLIAISNGLIVDLIDRDYRGENIEETCAIHNEMFKIITDGWIQIYAGQYPTMGNSRIMIAKIVWDTAAYWAVPGLLYFHDLFKRLVDHPQIVTGLAQFSVTSKAIQAFFRQWAAVAHSDPTSHDQGEPFLSFYDFEFMAPLHSGMTAEHPDEELTKKFQENVELVEFLSGQLIATVFEEWTSSSATTQQREQVTQWKESPLLTSLLETFERLRDTVMIDPGWITGHKSRQLCSKDT